MRVVRVQKDRVVVFVTQTFHERRRLFNADELALPFRHADQERQLQLSPGGEDRLQCTEVGDIKVADGHMAGIGIGKDFAEGFHAIESKYILFLCRLLESCQEISADYLTLI